MSLFPIFVKLAGRLVVVAGGGAIAAGKIPALLAAGARVRVVAPQLGETVAGLVREGAIEWLAKEFAPRDLEGAQLAVAATSLPAVNAAVFRAAERKGILANAVDDIENCHFYYGAVVQRGDLQIAISTGGKSPALAQRLRQELEAQFGPEYAQWLDWLGAARELLRAGNSAPEDTRRLLHQLASRPMFEKFLRDSAGSRVKEGVR